MPLRPLRNWCLLISLLAFAPESFLQEEDIPHNEYVFVPSRRLYRDRDRSPQSSSVVVGRRPSPAPFARDEARYSPKAPAPLEPI